MAVNGSNFNWHSLNRDTLASLLGSITAKVVNQKLTPEQFHKILGGHIKKHIPLIITKRFDPKVIKNVMFIGGSYNSCRDQAYKSSIEVVLVYNPNDEYLKISKSKFGKICYGIADTILHELIHMRQYRRRDFKDLPDYASTAEKTEQQREQRYLGCSDEIDAYGFNIACELLSKFNKDVKEVINHLDVNQKSVRTRVDSWRMYLKAFDHDHNHIIIKRLKKKIIRYLPYAIIGKPYRNKDWICY
jgi:hypothetical protein